MAGHQGTSLLEINAIIGVVPLASFLLCSIFKRPACKAMLSRCILALKRLVVRREWKSKEDARRTAVATMLLPEFCVTVLPLIGSIMGVVRPLQLLVWAASLSVVPCAAVLTRPAQAHRHAVAAAESLAQPHSM